MSTKGEVIDARADASRGTTEPGTELPGEARASNTRLPTGSTASSAFATYVSKVFGSLSASSTDTQVKAWPLPSAHWARRVVFP